ncbi:MAG: hypothetical protein A3F68_13225 [Acidobacteria bacterium RIFCSPLOWO2_12_FULL_54_10]|nr:MAG: hypothetical protein A3F68_13225 [Acidobacteria bacterium RIFCSPLOWO2_12_FULL_54_10]
MQFLSPLFLLGALAVGIPLWLHLIRHEEAVQLPFSSLMFLRRIPVKSAARQKLKYLILLSTRLLIILLIALAFAHPYFPSVLPFLAGGGGSGTHNVILLDESMSMAEGSRWQRAIEAARNSIGDFSESDQAQIVTFSSEFQIQNLPTFDKAALLAVLDGLKPAAAPTSYAQAARALERIKEDANQPLSVVLISDMQKSGLDASGQGLAFPPAKKFQLVDVADDEPPNWVVEGVRSRRLVLQARYPERLVVRLRGYKTPVSSKEVVLSIGSRVVGRKSVEIPDSGVATVVFEGFEVPLGENKATIQMTPADTLPGDDVYHFALERREPYRILFLHEGSESGELYYFRNALAAEPDSPFAVDARTPADAVSLSLEDYAMVIISNSGYIPESLITNVQTYVRGGGGVLFTMGSRVLFPSPDARWGDLWPGKSPAKQMLTQDNERFVLIGEFEREHPVFREFRDVGAESLRAVQVFAYVRLQPEGQVLMRFSNGDPSLIEKSYGQGRVLWFATSFDNVWSDFPLHPAFVPLAHQIVVYGTQLAQEPPSYIIPATISLEMFRGNGDNADANRIWDIRGPEGDREIPLGEEARVDYLMMRQSGFYEVHRRNVTHILAANPDPRESDLEQIAAEDRSLITGGGSSQNSGSIVSSPSDAPSRQSFWWNLLLVALVIAVTEAFLANYYLKMYRPLRTQEADRSEQNAN